MVQRSQVTFFPSLYFLYFLLFSFLPFPRCNHDLTYSNLPPLPFPHSLSTRLYRTVLWSTKRSSHPSQPHLCHPTILCRVIFLRVFRCVTSSCDSLPSCTLFRFFLPILILSYSHHDPNSSLLPYPTLIENLTLISPITSPFPVFSIGESIGDTTIAGSSLLFAAVIYSVFTAPPAASTSAH